MSNIDRDPVHPGRAPRPCTGAYHVARASVDATGATTDLLASVTGSVLDTLRVVLDASAAYLSPQSVGSPTSGFEPQRITSGGPPSPWVPSVSGAVRRAPRTSLRQLTRRVGCSRCAHPSVAAEQRAPAA